MINRFSSRLQKLDESFLNAQLSGALSYDRIAGYFSSSLLEIAGESIKSVQGKVRVVCNSNLDTRDVQTAQAAKAAIQKEWCSSEPELKGELSKPRFQQLYDLLISGKMEVKVLPSDVFGLVHGKAGVITKGDNSKTCFMGSANETISGWRMNYELVWEDTSTEGVTWVQREFDFLWQHKDACPLSEAVIADIGRISHRQEVSLDSWRQEPEAASPIVESPVYRKEYGLWAHQKYFVKKAFEAHKRGGARFVLADMVGLGKTIQLAMAAQLMALYGSKPVLVLAPKTLLWQWQDELKALLDMPSAVWNGKQWVDENGIEYPSVGLKGLLKCPRKIGIMSQGLITSGGEAANILRDREYECIIVDEAHRARRKKFDRIEKTQEGNRNNLMQFIYDIAPRTKSLLLATATPVQIHPIEAYDLLDMLSQGSEQVFGNGWSPWRHPKQVLDIILENKNIPTDKHEIWNWMRNPFPPEDSEENFFRQVRLQLEMKDNEYQVPPQYIDELTPALKRKIQNNDIDFFQKHNPFIRHIIRRTRQYLENTEDPQTHEPYLKPIKVRLSGETDREAIILGGYLKNAYETAEEFCKLLAQRLPSAGFLKTLLLRRLGSSIEAGRLTAEKMLNTWTDIELDEDDNDEEISSTGILNTSTSLTAQERQLLEKFNKELEIQTEDPKYASLKDYLLTKKWLEWGCIVFSQYYDTVRWHAYKLTQELPNEAIAIYAGGTKSGILKNSIFTRMEKDTLKAMVKTGEIRLLFGTDAASEGLNLQRLGSLINLDLPWNPTKLEQRKGRIQRIGQLKETVYIYNMRYLDSVEDRVHQLLSQRLEHIKNLFGQIPDVLEDVWVELAIGNTEKAKQIIDSIPPRHPFEMKYDKIENIDWESCEVVLNDYERRIWLLQGW